MLLTYVQYTTPTLTLPTIFSSRDNAVGFWESDDGNRIVTISAPQNWSSERAISKRFLRDLHFDAWIVTSRSAV
jgi:hypothetical protein